jgi:hypothetical protein
MASEASMTHGTAPIVPKIEIPVMVEAIEIPVVVKVIEVENEPGRAKE